MRILIVSLAMVCCPLAAVAHHATAVAYDRSNITELEGEITTVLWRNPHVRIDLLRIAENGEQEIWKLEAAAINLLQRLGVTTDDIDIGDRVRVAGAPDRQGRTRMFIGNMLLADGREMLMRRGAEPRWVNARTGRPDISADQAARAERLATGIFRVWSWSVDEITTTSLTAQARQAKESWDQLRDDTALRCISQGMPGVMFSPFPIEFIDQQDEIVLKVEEWDVVRTIRMGDQEFKPDQPASPLGDSVGRWEGGTLVVETTNVSWPHFDSIGTPQSEAVHIVERFALSADETRLSYDVTVTDPATFTAPAEITGGAWQWIPGEEIKPFDCTLFDE